MGVIIIYDTNCAHVYVDDEHEVTYEPPVLGFLRDLVAICGAVNQRLEEEITAKVKGLPTLPPEYTETTSGLWFGNITRKTTSDQIDKHCEWTDPSEEALIKVNQRLAEIDPTTKAKNLQSTKDHLLKLIELLDAIEAQVSDSAFMTFLQARQDAKNKRRAASEDAERVFASAPLDGVASESWRLLWEQARSFSETDAYPSIRFPNTSEKARCVFCQQLLDEDAKFRLQAFETFVTGNLERAASEAEALYEKIIQEQIEIPEGEKVNSILDLAGVRDDVMREAIRAYCISLGSRRKHFPNVDNITKLPVMPERVTINALEDLERKLEAEAKRYEEDAKSSDRSAIRKQKRELEVRKWLSDHRSSIEAEIQRLKSIHFLKEAQRLTNTKALSDKASRLSEELVTKAFKKRFDRELNALGVSWLKVSFEKVRTIKGQVWHKLALRDQKQPAKTRDVLSEGEFRIVSIAAFLADMTAEGNAAPIIVDDPISSLDQNFEERVAERLVAFSNSRQVIVLTHRLSLLSSLEEAARKAGIQNRVIALQREAWGVGEPGDPPLPAQKPKNALNALLDERLRKARKVYEEAGTAEYRVLAKAICSEIRITLERLIEKDLLADVIQRFRRPIQTLGKIDKLARINASDCQFIDIMMTKHSRYEHSQPQEAPVALPNPDELESDLKKLIGWLTEFSAREVPTV